MMKELEKVMIDNVEYAYDPKKEYINNGHAYCKICHKQKDGKVMDFLDRKWIFKNECDCDREKAKEEAKIRKNMEIDNLKRECFNSMVQWAYTFDNYQGEKKQCYTIAKNFVKDYEQMKKENIGLLFYGSVGSGKTYLACCIANALIENYQISVKIRNFAQIINELQKGGFDFDKNAYIESLVNTSVLILDDLGMERDTSYAKEQVYNIVNNRYLKHKPTIFTTNLPYDSIQNCTESIEYQRIYSRIIEMCIPVMVVGEDYRKKIQKDKLNRNKERLLTGGERT
ncbi:TPA: ATP-binding protein [Streptococcus equi subsp. zooepidemicus]|nr:ATP-binding protein [Streptococcus equi subsp. zooepidemicus]HEL0011287.1 ATP-binding protein [Streptococcus equi subsp. zooepidemicus]HEL0013357.1 ATP-binding protein [Streptococcus equi subsp. zooepidemicus]HEL0017465.1 ATP-binding protein [Streptococcus equi subsp. zooepidemicus]HEL0029321.1 ATP-binding protein [Streptococcus equi subsp. zooepidemicus]